MTSYRLIIDFDEGKEGRRVKQLIEGLIGFFDWKTMKIEVKEE